MALRNDLVLSGFLLVNVWIVFIVFHKVRELQETQKYHREAMVLNQKQQLSETHNETEDALRYEKKSAMLLRGLELVVNKESPSTPINMSNHCRPIEYGIRRTNSRVAYVMVRSELDKAVHNRLLQSPMFTCAESELLTYGLQSAVDYPRSRKTHIYHEGYFHSLRTSGRVVSRNPRSGKEMEKRAAGDFIRAFFESFRAVNNGTFEILRKELVAYSEIERARLTDEKDTLSGLVGASAYIAKWLSQGLHFSDLSVQIHYGSAIAGEELFWHSDAENSFLHFGVTIRGSRTLLSRRSESPQADPVLVREEQQPGSVYLSPSTLVTHAPEYPNTTWASRIVAVQARFLYSTSELKALRDAMTQEAWHGIANIIAQVLSCVDLKIPSLADVEDILAEWNKFK